MKTMSIGELVRRPGTAQKLTDKGRSVRVTHRGKPLWVVTPDVSQPPSQKDEKREAWLDRSLDELLAETPRPGKSAARMVIEDRR
ncbi:MAG: hypothetical protein ACKVY0_22910 [Prosthecobacter sp.]|uniref:hypothetical protein n=1 Tax=Prosthecobacter sp. TaxID=1965333 RepID=UPI0038FE6642